MGKPNNVSWYDLHVGKYRQGLSYRKNANHVKMSDERREEILTKKYWKQSRHKQNYKHRRWWYGGKGRQYCLNVAQRKLRRWFKHMMYVENFDAIPTEYPATMFYDPWHWD